MKKVFLDSDVILDLLLDREPFNADIAWIIESSIANRITLCISAVSVINLNDIIGRIENKNSADIKTAKILQLVNVEGVTESAIKKSIHSKFSDFEDGVQNFCAQEAKHKVIITRNTKDYKGSDLAIFTPKEYLARIK